MPKLMQDQINIIFSQNGKINNKNLKSVLDSSEASQNNLKNCAEIALKVGYYGVFYYTPEYREVTENFSLNFLWVNLNPQNRKIDIAENIIGDGLNKNENIFDIDFSTLSISKQPVMYRIFKWAQKGFKFINFWFDSTLVTVKSLKNTFKIIEEISKLTKTSIYMKDIRKISFDEYHPYIQESLHPKTPVYYRVDLLKLLITIHVLKTKEASYCCMSDVDIEPQNPEELIDKFTFNFLKKDGYVLTKTRMSSSILTNFENGFTIFSYVLLDELNKIIHGVTEKLSNFERLHSESIYLAIGNDFVLKKESNDDLFLSHPRKCIQTGISRFCCPGKTIFYAATEDKRNKFNLKDHKSECFSISESLSENESGGIEKQIIIHATNGRFLREGFFNQVPDQLPYPLSIRTQEDGEIVIF
jgi:hypothetical protein